MKILDCLEVLEREGIQYEFNGNVSTDIAGFSSIYRYKSRTMTWIRNITMLDSDNCEYIGNFRLIVTGGDVDTQARFDSQIKVDDPRKAFFTIVETLWGHSEEAIIADSAIISEGAVIGDGVSIGANSVISAKSIIGNDCKIGSNVTFKGKVELGNGCVIQSGAVLGEDGFAFVQEEFGLKPVAHFGGVKLGNHVLVGSNTCICRGTIDDTTLHDYVKVDTLCHIAHNCIIHENTQVITGAVVMGSVKVGRNCWISTSVIRDQVKIGDNVIVGMGAVVTKDIPEGVTVIGNPARALEEKK